MPCFFLRRAKHHSREITNVPVEGKRLTVITRDLMRSPLPGDHNSSTGGGNAAPETLLGQEDEGDAADNIGRRDGSDYLESICPSWIRGFGHGEDSK